VCDEITFGEEWWDPRLRNADMDVAEALEHEGFDEVNEARRLNAVTVGDQHDGLRVGVGAIVGGGRGFGIDVGFLEAWGHRVLHGTGRRRHGPERKEMDWYCQG